MKRALGLILVISAVILGLLSLKGTMPFMPVFGTSMEPELKVGNLILIEEILPSEVKEGDVIIFEVPAMVREHYNYPPVVAHRAIKVLERDGQAVGFRTKGDNVGGEDPFTVRPQDLRGQVSKQIPYLGFPLLFLQSKYGTIFAMMALCLFALFLYADELGRVRRRMLEGLLSPVVEEQKRVEQTMIKFAQAIEVYAQHLKSHTSAIISLSEASQELKKSATEQNKVLSNLSKVVEKMSGGIPAPVVEEPGTEELREPEVSVTVRDLEIIPNRVKPCKVVNVFAEATNNGPTTSFSLVLKVRDMVEAVKEITLGPGQSQKVAFTVLRDKPGVYELAVALRLQLLDETIDSEGLKGSFIVEPEVEGEVPNR